MGGGVKALEEATRWAISERARTNTVTRPIVALASTLFGCDVLLNAPLKNVPVGLDRLSDLLYRPTQ